jgi:hypothetical protein
MTLANRLLNKKRGLAKSAKAFDGVKRRRTRSVLAVDLIQKRKRTTKASRLEAATTTAQCRTIVAHGKAGDQIVELEHEADVFAPRNE